MYWFVQLDAATLNAGGLSACVARAHPADVVVNQSAHWSLLCAASAQVTNTASRTEAFKTAAILLQTDV